MDTRCVYARRMLAHERVIDDQPVGMRCAYECPNTCAHAQTRVAAHAFAQVRTHMCVCSRSAHTVSMRAPNMCTHANMRVCVYTGVLARQNACACGQTRVFAYTRARASARGTRVSGQLCACRKNASLRTHPQMCAHTHGYMLTARTNVYMLTQSPLYACVPECLLSRATNASRHACAGAYRCVYAWAGHACVYARTPVRRHLYRVRRYTWRTALVNKYLGSLRYMTCTYNCNYK